MPQTHFLAHPTSAVALNAFLLPLSPSQIKIHNKALTLSQRHREIESEIIEILFRVESSKLYKNFGLTSLFAYAVEKLNFTEAVAFSFIAVMRKSRLLPELKQAISGREISVSKIQRFLPVINQHNAKGLIAFAKTHTNREIEKEAVRLNPNSKAKDGEHYVGEKMVQVKVSIPEELYKKLKRVQDLESQRTRTPVTMGETMAALVEGYLRKHDPVERAKRADLHQALNTNTNTNANANATNANAHTNTDSQTPVRKRSQGQKQTQNPGLVHAEQRGVLPGEKSRRFVRQRFSAAEKHTVIRRDGGRCTFVDAQGERCKNARWIELHHVNPVSQGGTNDPDTIRSVCASHHDLIHQYSFPLDGQITWLRPP